MRAVFAALAKPDPVIRSGSDEFHDAISELTRSLDRHRQRLAGEPVVVGRVRLDAPRRRPRPVARRARTGRRRRSRALVHGRRRLERLAPGDRSGGLRVDSWRCCATRSRRWSSRSPPWCPGSASWPSSTNRPRSSSISIRPTTSSTSLPTSCTGSGSSCSVPSTSCAPTVTVRGTASESPHDDRKARFGKEALVDGRR